MEILHCRGSILDSYSAGCVIRDSVILNDKMSVTCVGWIVVGIKQHHLEGLKLTGSVAWHIIPCDYKDVMLRQAVAVDCSAGNGIEIIPKGSQH